MFKEFKQFALRGNAIDMAVGIIIGSAFGGIVNSLVNDVIMPPIGLLLGGIDFANFYVLLDPGSGAEPYLTISDAQSAGAVTINYGLFINALISFLIITVVLFFIIRAMNQLLSKKKAPAKAETKTCPYCISSIPIEATRCPQCTSDL